jgi:four helix bundle protein
VQRASVSVPSNIGEGYDRLTNNEFIRFLRIAKGSCGESRTQLIIAEKVGLIENGKELIEQTIQELKMIQKMITYRDSLRK